jgi:hypothetical protein
MKGMPTEKLQNGGNAEKKKYRLREADRKISRLVGIPTGENADWEKILTEGNSTEGNSD